MENEIQAIQSILDTLFPVCELDDERAETEIELALKDIYAFSVSSCEGLPSQILTAMDQHLNRDQANQLHIILRLLANRWGTLLLCGRHCLSSTLVPTAFIHLPPAQRASVLRSWYASSLPQFRKVFKGIKSLLLSATMTWLDPHTHGSPLLTAMAYPVSDPYKPAHPRPAALDAERAVTASLIDLKGKTEADISVKEAAAMLRSKGLMVVFPPSPHTGGSTTEETSSAAEGHVASTVWASNPSFAVVCDAIVVGSGAGGGVAASRLAAAGLKVVVVEKGGFVAAADMTGREGEAFGSMMECGGLLTTEDGCTSVLAGSTLGGGTRVNWSASFRTPDHVRKEWAERLGLTAFTGPEYDKALDAVCQRLSVHTGFRHGPACSALASGLQAAGFDCGEVPRNCVDERCGGHCTFGCARGAKQDSVNTFLADACLSGNTRIVTGLWADRILTESIETTPSGQKRDAQPKRQSTQEKKAVGVLAMAAADTTSPCGGSSAVEKEALKVAFVAPLVVSSAGAIHTPALMLRSGIRSRGNVGAKFKLHPCTVVVGTFPEDAEIPEYCGEQRSDGCAYPGDCKALGSIRSWQGPNMSVFSRQVADWQGTGYGALLYNPAAHPGLFAAAAPWLSGRDFKDLLQQYRNSVAVLVLVRDQGCGKVTVDASGYPRLHYSIIPRDRNSMIKGIIAGLRALEAAGATKLMTLLNSEKGRCSLPPASQTPGAERSSARDTDRSEVFEAYVQRMEAIGVPPLSMPTFSAHQLGTASMGVDRTTSAVDPLGESWEVEGLFVCDGSVLPTSTGVNPMISIEAVAYFIAEGIHQKVANQAKPAAGGGLAYEE